MSADFPFALLGREPTDYFARVSREQVLAENSA